MKIRTTYSFAPLRLWTAERTRTLMMAGVMCAFFKPAHYIIGSTFNKLWKLYTLVVCIVGVCYFFYKRHGTFQKRDSSLLFIALGYLVCYIFSTLLNYRNGYFFDAVQNMIETVGYLCIAAAGILFHTKTFFKGYLISGLFWTVLHLFTILIYQDGGMRSGRSMHMSRSFSENWYLLTHANASYFIIISVIAVFFFYAYTYNKKLRVYAWLYLLFSIFCFLTQWSVAGLMGLCILAVLLAVEAAFSRLRIGNIRTNKRKVSLKVYLFLVLLMDVLLTFGKLLERSLNLMYLYFNKMHSLQARVTIWEKCIALLKQNFLFGFGWETEDVTILKTTYNHMHNILLEVLYRGGIAALILFGLGLWIAFFYAHSYQNRRTPGYRILAYAFVAFMISSNFDFYMYRYEILIVPVIFLYYETVMLNHKTSDLSAIGR